jgi:uncharacterized protein
MSLLDKLKHYILPKEVDFFGNLRHQCRITEDIVEELYRAYVLDAGDTAKMQALIAEAKKMRARNLVELNNVLITPVDKEAISRTYVNLHWIVLSIKHLDVEIAAYAIRTLKEYEPLFGNLKDQMHALTGCFLLLKEKRYQAVQDRVYGIIHFDNELIRTYSDQLAALFRGDDLKRILQHKEILSQIKEVSKRIHVCANTVEDMVFKMS